jgi:2'-5' RNA ligase
MSFIRAFIAIELPQELQTALGGLVAQFARRKIQAIRWVAAQNIHLTLHFLGDTAPEKLEEISAALRPLIARQEPFTFRVEGIGAFPNLHRPRVIWSGLQAPADLPALQLIIEQTVKQSGLPVEDREFSPHLTIGRVKKDATLQEIQLVSATLQEIKIGVLGTVHVESVTLFRSDLRPQGSLYTPLYRFPLKVNPHIAR